MSDVTVEIFGKPGCHLCDDARAILDRVVADFPSVEVVEHNILDNAEWFESMQNEIPVVTINRTRHAQWHIIEADLRAALTEVTG
jgi:glutaredoxin